MNLFKSIKTKLNEGYSLGDDKESFDVWEKEEKKLKGLVDSLKEDGIDFTNIDIEHSQDSIYSADFTIKGIPESNINDELEYELRDKFVSGYDSYFENIQLENWGGYGPICIIGFDIDSADSSKWRFGTKVKEVINIVSKDGGK